MREKPLPELLDKAVPTQPAPAFRRQTPADRIQAGGAQDVLALIDQLRDGSFV